MLLKAVGVAWELALLFSGVWAGSLSPPEAGLVLVLLNQDGNPCLKLKPPGGNFSSSRTTTPLLSSSDEVYSCTVNGASRGWKTSVENVMRGGIVGYAAGNDIWNRKIAGAYGPGFHR